MVRISDARMSGTAYGTVVLHMSPEAAAGGPLALVRDGDKIKLDVAKRRLELVDRLEKRLLPGKTVEKPSTRGRARPLEAHFDFLYVPQAHQGVDLDFLVGKSGAFVPRDNH